MDGWTVNHQDQCGVPCLARGHFDPWVGIKLASTFALYLLIPRQVQSNLIVVKCFHTCRDYTLWMFLSSWNAQSSDDGFALNLAGFCAANVWTCAAFSIQQHSESVFLLLLRWGAIRHAEKLNLWPLNTEHESFCIQSGAAFLLLRIACASHQTNIYTQKISEGLQQTLFFRVHWWSSGS